MSEVLKTSSSTETACEVNHHTALTKKRNNCPILAASYTHDDVQLYYCDYCQIDFYSLRHLRDKEIESALKALMLCQSPAGQQLYCDVSRKT